MSNVGLFLGGTPGGADGTEITALAPGTVPDIPTTGVEVISAAVRVNARVLLSGFRSAGAFTIELVGTNASRWQLAPDVAGSPGTWQAWGASLALIDPLEDVNVPFWMRARAIDGETVGVETDDLSVVLRTPDSVLGLVGRSWVLPYAIPASSAVGASWALPYTVRNVVGASWVLPYAVKNAVARSWVLPYSIAAAGITDGFSSLDTATWLVVTSGTGSVAASGGKAVITKPDTSSKAHMLAKVQPLPHGGTWTVTALVDLSNEGASDYQHPVLALARKSSAPTSGDSFTDAYFPLRIELYSYSVDGRLYYRFKFINTSPAAVWYDFGGGGAWSTTFDGATDGTGSWKVLPGGNDQAQFQYVVEADATNGVRFKVKSADGTTTHDTSAWVAWSAITGSGDYYIAFGAWQYDFTTAFSGVINVDSVAVT